MSTDEEWAQPEQDEEMRAVLVVVGKVVKHLRERKGLKQTELGEAIGYSESLVAAVEQAVRVPQPEFLDGSDVALEADGLLTSLKEDVEGAKYPAAVRNLARLEAKAAVLSSYDCMYVPGLLQTEDYARALFTTRLPVLDESSVQERVEARMARQAVLHNHPAPIFSAVIEEAVLHRPLGGRAVLRGQWEQLLRVGQLRNVAIQVMPTEREERAGASSTFMLLEIPGRPKMFHVGGALLSRLTSEPKDVHAIEAQHGILRAEALAPRESLSYIEKLLGET